MEPPSRAQLRRRRLGLPERAIDANTSAVKRKAAMARWSKAGKTYPPEPSGEAADVQQAEETRGGLVLHAGVEHYRARRLAARAAANLEQAKIDAMYDLGDLVRDAVRIHRAILLDPNAPAQTRLRAVEMCYDAARLGLTVDKPILDIEDMSIAQLDEVIAAANRDLAKLGTMP